MAFLAHYQLASCPFCGKDAIYLQDRDGESYFYIATCEDRTCQGHNELMFDDKDACCNWWNAMCENVKAESKKQDESEGSEDDVDTFRPVITGIQPVVGENPSSVASIIAVGTNLDENEVFAWTLFFNTTVVADSSTGWVLHLTPSESGLYSVATTVRVSVSVGDYTSDMFTLKG